MTAEGPHGQNRKTNPNALVRTLCVAIGNGVLIHRSIGRSGRPLCRPRHWLADVSTVLSGRTAALCQRPIWCPTCWPGR